METRWTSFSLMFILEPDEVERLVERDEKVINQLVESSKHNIKYHKDLWDSTKKKDKWVD